MPKVLVCLYQLRVLTIIPTREHSDVGKQIRLARLAGRMHCAASVSNSRGDSLGSIRPTRASTSQIWWPDFLGNGARVWWRWKRTAARIHLGRQLAAQGHQVRLMSPEYVRATSRHRRTMTATIAEAATRPTARRPDCGLRYRVRVRGAHGRCWPTAGDGARDRQHQRDGAGGGGGRRQSLCAPARHGGCGGNIDLYT